MAKKFGKFLLFTAAMGAVAAGTYYYLQNKTPKLDDDDDDFDDFDEYDDDFDEDEDETEESGRSYVSLDLDNAAPTDTDKNNTQEAANKASVGENVTPGETVEEFFDDEDTSMDAM